MRVVVQKFGGSSLADPSIRKEALQRVWDAVEVGFTPVVVVSAMGRGGDPYATDTLLNLLMEVNPKTDALNTDLLLSCGEIISATIFAAGLQTLGLPAVALTGWQAGIYTDDVHLGARVQEVHGEKIWEVLKKGKIPVVTGFQGVTQQGAVTTLGRGGSDTTAAVLGVVLQAERVEIYTDVDGIKTADPRLIPDAPTLQVLSYREVVELAHMGAKVLHPRAAEISMEEGIPIQVRSVSKSNGGTTIGHGVRARGGLGSEPVTDRLVTGIAHLGKRAQVKITGSEDFHSSGLAPEIFQRLATAGVSVDLIFLSPDLIAFIIDEGKVEITQNVLTPLGLNVKIKMGFAKVSVVGAGMHGVPGVMARVVNSLEREGVRIFQTTDSHANISCLVLEEHIPQAVQALYGEFNLDRI
ncbi:MAG: aspartate kinase [Firmicutes bacterium]|nr:aspartate kinase [Bacillota bacterium]